MKLANTFSLVSSMTPDWSRENCARFDMNPGKRLLAAIREYQRWSGKPGTYARLRRSAAAAEHAWWQAVTGADIPLETQIGGGLLIPHPNGIVMHPGVVIGPNCLIFQQVTLGTRGDREGVPVLGGHVDIGAGAKVLGPVHIGDHAKIGANAVVLIDVPEGATAIGIPARIHLPKENGARPRPRSRAQGVIIS